MQNNQSSTYEKIVNKVKKHTGIETISVSVLPGELIVDDTSVPKCICHVANFYNAPYMITGMLTDVGLNINDLEDIGVLTPLYVTPSTIIYKGK